MNCNVFPLPGNTENKFIYLLEFVIQDIDIKEKCVLWYAISSRMFQGTGKIRLITNMIKSLIKKLFQMKFKC